MEFIGSALCFAQSWQGKFRSFLRFGREHSWGDSPACVMPGPWRTAHSFTSRVCLRRSSSQPSRTHALTPTVAPSCDSGRRPGDPPGEPAIVPGRPDWGYQCDRRSALAGCQVKRVPGLFEVWDRTGPNLKDPTPGLPHYLAAGDLAQARRRAPGKRIAGRRTHDLAQPTDSQKRVAEANSPNQTSSSAK